MFGAHRYFFNQTKSVCDKAVQEGDESRVAELFKAKADQGICRAGACSNGVVDIEADFTYKRRWFCETHIEGRTFGAKPRLLGVSRPYERQIAAFDGTCRTSGCDVAAEPGVFRCEEHADDGAKAKDPRAPTPKSPFNYESTKSLIVKDSTDLLDNEKWHQGIPSNSKSAAVKQYIAASKATLTKRRNGDTKAQLPGFKSKRSYDQEFSIRDSAISFRKAKAKCPPKKRGRKGRATTKVSPWFNRRSKGREWELRIFPGQDFDAAFQEDDVTDQSDRAHKRPIRMKRQDMVRLKRAMTMGMSGYDADFCEAKITRDRAHHFHLCLPIKVQEREPSPI